VSLQHHAKVTMTAIIIGTTTRTRGMNAVITTNTAVD